MISNLLMATGSQAPISTIDLVDPFGDGSGIALYKFDGDATDSAGNYDGTPTNVTYGAGKFGQCGVFNGSSSRVDINQFAYSSDNFTVSCYVKFNVINKEQRYVVLNSKIYNKYFRISCNSSGYIYALYGATNSSVINSTSVATVGSWYHLVLTVIKNSNISFHINGTLIEIKSTSAYGYAPDIFNVAKIGCARDNAEVLNGSIDQVRIFNRALTQEEVTALYNESVESYTPPVYADFFSDGSEILNLKLDGDATDSAGNYDGTPTNVTYGAGKFGQCGVFNGSSSRVDINQFAYSSDNFTVSCYVKFNVINKEQRYVVLNSKIYNKYFRISCNSSGYIYALYGATNSSVINSTSVATVGSWYHLVLTVIKNSNISFHINGTLIEIKSTSAYGYAPDIFNVAKIGCARDNAEVLNGSIDQVRIFNRALTQEEVTALYNEGQ